MKDVTSSPLRSILLSYVSRLALCIIMTIVLLPGIAAQSAWAETEEKATDVGLGIASFVTTLPYGAVKMAYAGLGAVIGGLTYLLTAGDIDSANSVWENSLLGTYVLTPEHLKGEKPIRFMGP